VGTAEASVGSAGWPRSASRPLPEATGRAERVSTAVNTAIAATGRSFVIGLGPSERGRRGRGDGRDGAGHNRAMAEEPECHKVEWTRLEIGERSWRVKLEYG
jgi:hypothetical protein